MKLNNQFFTVGELGALITWAIVFGISLYWLPVASPEIRANSAIIVSLFILYIVLFLAIARVESVQHKPQLFWTLYVAMFLCAFAISYYLPMNFLSILTIIWVAVLPHLMGLRSSLMVMLAVVSLWFALKAYWWEDKNALFEGLLWSTFHFFAIMMSYETRRAEIAKQEAQHLNKELQSAQHLLAEASRQNERTRIARDLHDLLGHHLTALIIQLQVAGHMADGEVKDKVDQCHSLAKLLLSDVREAVTSLRDNQSLDFRKMIQLIIDNTPRLEISAQIDAELKLDDLALAKTLLSCVQEALTNSLRHSGARRFWITLKRGEQGLDLQMYDDGQVRGQLQQGNGLQGMQERIHELSGRLSFEKQNKAMLINIQIPNQQSLYPATQGIG